MSAVLGDVTPRPQGFAGAPAVRDWGLDHEEVLALRLVNGALFATPDYPPFPSTRLGRGPRDALRAFPAPFRLEVRGCLNPIAPLMDGRREDPWLSPSTPPPLQSTGTLGKSDMRIRMEGANLHTEKFHYVTTQALTI